MSPGTVFERIAGRTGVKGDARTEYWILTDSPTKALPFDADSNIISEPLLIMPDRARELEAAERIRRRRNVFAAQLVSHAKKPIPKTDEMLDAERDWAWDDKVYPLDQVVAIAQHAQVAATHGTSHTDAAQMTWEALDAAYRDYTDIRTELTRRLRQSGPAASQTGVDQDVDMEALRKEMDEHEQKLESCIITPDKIRSTSFADVHLPSATIDAIRSMVSLPLLYPEAFNSGVLKSHSTNGALLFGPPGTGKTLLARATAMEAGARMMVVKASDINDKWLGESEKQYVKDESSPAVLAAT